MQAAVEKGKGVDDLEEVVTLDEATAVMARRRELLREMARETKPQQDRVTELQASLEDAKIDLHEAGAPYRDNVNRMNAMLFDYFKDVADTLPGTKRNRMHKGGQWGEGSGFKVGNDSVEFTDKAMTAICDAGALAEISDPWTRRQEQVEALADAFPWLMDYAEEVDEERLDGAIDLLLSMVKPKLERDKRKALQVLSANCTDGVCSIASENLHLKKMGVFTLDGEAVLDAGGTPMKVNWRKYAWDKV